MPHSVHRWTKIWALGCKKFWLCPAWLLLSNTGPLFSPSLLLYEDLFRNAVMISCGFSGNVLPPMRHCITPHQKGTQVRFWLPARIPAPYEPPWSWLSENITMKKIYSYIHLSRNCSKITFSYIHLFAIVCLFAL